MKKLFTLSLLVAALSSCHSDENVFAEKGNNKKDTVVQVTDTFR